MNAMLQPANAAVGKSFLNDIVHVEADEQAFDIQHNKATFTGNVVIRQGTMMIYAAKATATQTQSKPVQQIIELTGNPVTFKNTLEDGKHVEGHAKKIIYHSQTGVVELQINAFLNQDGNTLTGETISYNLVKKNVVAKSKKGGRIKSVLLPTQLNSTKSK